MIETRIARSKVLTIFGTRPEVIKLAPIIQRLERRNLEFETANISSGQHKDLLYPFLQLFGIRVDHDLQVMKLDQTPSQVCARVLAALDPILMATMPDLVVVQGDTTTAMSGALAAFHRGIPVAHVEAGLRTGNDHSPHPEEMNRRLITRLATYHFAATRRNREALISEGVAQEKIFVTGNPIVDSLEWIRKRVAPLAPALKEALLATEGLKRLVLTTHRRESFGATMAANLRVLRNFVEAHGEVALIFPVHPNPSVMELATDILGSHPRIRLVKPLDYQDFVVLLSHAWLIVSDSGGVQEEAPTLKKPLLILRESTERPEAIESGIARLVGKSPERLAAMLDEVYRDGNWIRCIEAVENPFGTGDSGERIVDIVGHLLARNKAR
ncbi:MAG TPA: UDP-N-acetylglucosamine 2-epimerase (non-hydrolyzing) [Candidatus Binatia bacterium]|nr:UDP-N-acetylglucosamine 2-epimerase (non-hydrolyzing) [Candidatus Binatia bacterium]